MDSQDDKFKSPTAGWWPIEPERKPTNPNNTEVDQPADPVNLAEDSHPGPADDVENSPDKQDVLGENSNNNPDVMVEASHTEQDKPAEPANPAEDSHDEPADTDNKSTDGSDVLVEDSHSIPEVLADNESAVSDTDSEDGSDVLVEDSHTNPDVLATTSQDQPAGPVSLDENSTADPEAKAMNSPTGQNIITMATELDVRNEDKPSGQDELVLNSPIEPNRPIRFRYPGTDQETLVKQAILLVEERPSLQLLKRAVCAVLYRGPANEVETTIKKAYNYLYYSNLAGLGYVEHPLMADLKVNLTSPDTRAR